MSEFIDNQTRRKETLKRVIRQLHGGRTVDEVKGEFAALLENVGASEVAEIEQALIEEGLPEMEIKRLCDVHVAVFRESLEAQTSPDSLPGHPLHTFRAENVAAEQALGELEAALAAVQANPQPQRLTEAERRLHALREYERHYARKEQLLFPYLEQHGFMGPSAVMWAIHDDVRAGWKTLAALLAAGPEDDPAAFAARVGEVTGPLVTAIREMFFKEAQILFPAALDKLNDGEWQAIRSQEVEFGYYAVQPGSQWPIIDLAAQAAPPRPSAEGLLPLTTGALTARQVDLLLSHLPVEISLVDAEDTLRFFSQGDERIFPRTPAVIGRKVQKCHPPASVQRVQRILDDFRSGRRDEAEFWIQMRERFIYIRYLAMRDEQGVYQGTLEVVQDVTAIRALQGERRLLEE